ncbi:GNAT family N-acetyltransferase [Sphingobium sp. AN558]|uniref:GNAT family N-acetyltransferase n=1 Tax=Sphingobium sp. AN558 TaxID=3133442 RepID=UPI0030C5504C
MFARTPRLLLRPGWMEDAPALAEAIGNDAVLRNLAAARSPYGLTEAQAFLARPLDHHMPQLLAFTRTLGAPRLVGGCGISQAPDGTPELGYWIARPYWGLGFATEAGQAVMSIARATGLSGVRAFHFADNPASGNVLRKIGFRFTGRTETRFSATRRAPVDCLLFEESAVARMANDPALELYRDGGPALAA